MSRHRVVVIGSGFGGLTATKALKNAPVDVTMIAQTQHHLFQPLLYQVATGILSEGEIAPATRKILRDQRNAEVLLGDVIEINLAGRYVVSEALGLRYETAYDSLIVAAGAGQSYFGNHHFAEFAPGMKTIDDALEVRRAGDLAHLHPGGDPVGRRRRPGHVTRGGHRPKPTVPARPVPGGPGLAAPDSAAPELQCPPSPLPRCHRLRELRSGHCRWWVTRWAGPALS